MKKLLGIIAFLSSGLFVLYKKVIKSKYIITCQGFRYGQEDIAKDTIKKLLNITDLRANEIINEVNLKLSEAKAHITQSHQNTVYDLNIKVPGLEYSTEQEANSAYDKLKATGAFSMLLIYKGGLIIRQN